MSTVEASASRHGRLHPVFVMLAMLVAAVALTHLVPAGKFDHHGAAVVPGSYHQITKVNGLPALLASTAPTATETPARAAGLVAFFTAIPAGLAKSVNLTFMLMFVGGMFGVLRATGAIDAGVDRLLHLTSGNVYFLTTGLMLVLACGGTFLGFMSEYLAIVPLVMNMGQRLRLPNLFTPAIIVVSSMIGWAASATNPLALTVVQPLAGVPISSGFMPRFGIFAVMFAVSLAYVLLYLRRLPKVDHIPEAARLTGRQVCILASVVMGGTALVIGTGRWSWGSPELSAAFIAFGVLLGLVGGLRPGTAADAFLDGMKGMLLAGLMFGLASAMEIVLQWSQILDTIVHGLGGLIQGHSPVAVAEGMMAGEMMFGVLIHSVMPKAAISLPILAPIAHLSGVSGEVTTAAVVLGSGLTNMVSPTNGLLMAFLAASKVDYVEWVRFMAPLFAVLCIVAFVAVYLMTVSGA
jgi:uncharacterized ion transporter superfamily protein YfcC